ncbi:GNAT family N-acetyltransferase [Parasediminibacterium paludis]|uniref:GNAT family N-acetyltransferase n=1 Tax=Parasediminibacterium paludis TaxID=908966 RepID=A0ABV8Q1K2_9BACT
MHKLVRTNADNPDFITLVQQLDKDLAIRDGDEHAFYAQYNGITAINHTVIAYNNGVAVACGAIKAFDNDSMEVKRMYTVPHERSKGFAGQVLAALEAWAIELGFTSCVLETGKMQPEAIALYTKCGYYVIPNYGQYIGIDNSVCFKKEFKMIL